MRRWVYNLLFNSKRKGDLGWWFDAFIITLIVVNTIAIILESVDSISMPYDDFFRKFETYSVIVFTIEYVLRVWTANSIPKYKRPVLGNIKYMFSAFAIIDFLAILPFYLPFFGIDLRFLRIMRIFRFFRTLKIIRYISAIVIISNVFKSKKNELVISFIFMFFVLLISSSLMYYVENEVQPDVFRSIPETMWWGIATLTTVGYGDIYPITALGKLLGGIIALIGIGLFALPAGILASGFSEELTRRRMQSNECPACGQCIKNQDEDFLNDKKPND